ncbi:MAG: hypothetical protein ACOY7J_17195 [Pseudomonadota bacterium]
MSAVYQSGTKDHLQYWRQQAATIRRAAVSVDFLYTVEATTMIKLHTKKITSARSIQIE